jgi:hypothetical protein
MWEPQILQLSSSIFLLFPFFSFPPHLSPNNLLLFSTLWILLLYPLHHMDGESGLSSGNKNAGILGITVNTWVPTGKPHCLQPECLIQTQFRTITAKFQITFPSHPLSLCVSHL